MKKWDYTQLALVIVNILVLITNIIMLIFLLTMDRGANIITSSSEIKVELVDDAGISIEDQTLRFITPSDDTKPIFEPGASFYTQEFYVKNAGDTPILFTFSVSRGYGGDMIEFYQAFDVWIVSADNDLEKAIRITDFKGELYACEISEGYRLCVKMRETAGNEFQSTSFSDIEITVYAVQKLY